MLCNERAVMALLAVTVLAVYGNALNADFQFDDFNVIVDNPAVHSLAAWRDAMPAIRPLLKFSYALNWTFSSAPWGFHLFNVLVHAVNTVLVWSLLRAIAGERAVTPWAPLAGALLFALHPVHTEAVTYVSGRSVSLMALFYLGSIAAWLRAWRETAQAPWRGLSAGLFVAALLVKETAVTLPFALLLLETTRSSPAAPVAQTLRRLQWHWLVLTGAVVLMGSSPTYRHLLDVSVASRSTFDNLLTQVNALGYLAGQLLAPWRMNIDPDLPVMTGMTSALIVPAGALLALAATGLYNWQRRTWLALAIFWFLLHLMPTNSLLPRLDVANDRQLYLASIGVFLATGIGIAHWVRMAHRRLLPAAFCAMVLLGLGVATLQRNELYESAVALWEDAARKSPSKPRVANNLGYAYQQVSRPEAALLAYRRAIELDPDYWKARINLDALQSAPPR